jgi:hypothetical protein
VTYRRRPRLKRAISMVPALIAEAIGQVAGTMP